MALLTEAEVHSAVWVKLKEHMLERLEKARRKNDANLNSDDTARLRGAIAELKYLSELDNPAPSIKADAGFE